MISLNFSEISLTFLKVLFEVFIISLNGRHTEFGIDPLLTFFLGSGTLPSNLSLLLASITVKFFCSMFSFISRILFTRFLFSVAL